LSLGGLRLSLVRFSFLLLRGALFSFLAVTMTKLAQWLWGLAILGSTWAALTTGALGLELPLSCQEVLWPLPAYLLVSAGCYAMATVGYRVATFHDCEDAARELQSQIQEARADLARRGLRF
uniref:Dolichol-phosphate mannosyltransferase subunit 3 n=1 Tax=Chlorocebus sabaeus TaxID=60711 RepID=A0A0D9SAP4_CHLSB